MSINPRVKTLGRSPPKRLFYQSLYKNHDLMCWRVGEVLTHTTSPHTETLCLKIETTEKETDDTTHFEECFETVLSWSGVFGMNTSCEMMSEKIKAVRILSSFAVPSYGNNVRYCIQYCFNIVDNNTKNMPRSIFKT